MKFSRYKLNKIFSAAFLLFAVFSACPQVLPAASRTSNPLDNSNSFPRAAAMGSAFVGLADDATALFSNPAGLGYLNRWQLMADSNFWLVDTHQETILLGIPGPSQWGNFAVAFSYLDYGTFEGRDNAGSLAPNYSANRVNARVSWGLKILEEVSLGLGIQSSQTSLADNSYTALAGDIGFLAKPFENFKAGFSYDNLGVNSQSGAVEDAFNLGASYEVNLGKGNQLITALGGTVEPSAVSYLQAGVEYGLEKLFFLRAGYQLPLSDTGIPGLTGLTAGLGLNLSSFSFDYAYLPYGDLGSSHRVSVGYNFETGNSSSTKSNKVLPSKESGQSLEKAVSSTSAKGTLVASDFPKTSIHRSKSTTGPLDNERATSSSSLVSTGGFSMGTSQMSTIPPTGQDIQTDEKMPPVQSLGTTMPKPETEDLKAKDSLVVQFDLADDSTSDGADLEKQGKFEEALRSYRSTIQKNPRDTSAWWALGNLYRRFNQKTYAIQCFNQVIKLEPNNQKLADWLEQYKAIKQ